MIAWIAEVAQANINLLESKGLQSLIFTLKLTTPHRSANRIQKEIEAEMDLILQQEAEAQAEEDRREVCITAQFSFRIISYC